MKKLWLSYKGRTENRSGCRWLKEPSSKEAGGFVSESLTATPRRFIRSSRATKAEAREEQRTYARRAPGSDTQHLPLDTFMELYAQRHMAKYAHTMEDREFCSGSLCGLNTHSCS
ncbi:hypothetical protein NDU88_003596 [Pleurodeles waltl]|uniref:Uncharacterized protein n=1 Tax=Pleurodeles waltl TaxID=8319 RepID=A0AAV7V0F7_PLEWA|nr:hypothetical protein NDU88_003596 [Pleurodeles waltl]